MREEAGIMLYAMLFVIGLTAASAVIIVGQRSGSFAAVHHAPINRAKSPVDEAESILAHRYAKGEVTAEEYDRMLAILRR
jgi:uncharacterized membrane protein